MDTEILIKKSEYRDTKILIKKSEYRDAEIGNNNLKINYYQHSNLNFSVSSNRQYSANTRVENVDLMISKGHAKKTTMQSLGETETKSKNMVRKIEMTVHNF